MLTMIDCIILDFFRFQMAVQLGSRWFPYIECSNKKEGKKEAADVALRVLMAEGSYQLADAALTVSSVYMMYSV